MPTIHHIKGTELPLSLRNKFNVEAHQLLTVTVKIEDNENCVVKDEAVNAGADIIKGLKEIIAAKRSRERTPRP